MDESFFEFFGLTARTGFFCHGAVGIPEGEYPRLNARLKPIVEDYRTLLGYPASELKHAEFERIEFAKRRDLAIRIRNAMWDAGAFIAGFYTPLRSFVLEHVRMNLLGKETEIPAEFQPLYDDAVRELRESLDQGRASSVIAELLHVPIGACANLLATLKCRFTVLHDPRESREDRHVRTAVAAYGEIFEALKGLEGQVDMRTDLADYYGGFSNDRSSEDEIGLQLADLVVGETRRFFQAHGELMAHGASPRLITPGSEEPVMTVVAVEGRLLKSGVLHSMPEAIQRVFFEDDLQGRYVWPSIRSLLIAGVLTCYSSWGVPRHLLPFDGVIFDQLD